MEVEMEEVASSLVMCCIRELAVVAAVTYGHLLPMFPHVS